MNNQVMGVILTGALLSPATMAAVNLPMGTQELSLQGSLDLDYVDDYLFVLNTSYGYFIRDKWEVGGILDASLSKSAKQFQFGAFTEYNFTNQSQWVPYIGLAAQVANLSGDDDDLDFDFSSATALNMRFSGGIKYFINPKVAISAEVNYNIATDDISITDDGVKKSFTRFYFGTKFYF